MEILCLMGWADASFLLEKCYNVWTRKGKETLGKRRDQEPGSRVADCIEAISDS
jgi:hypothetical protein